MGNLRKKTVGEKFFTGTVTITDPCYSKGTWCTEDVVVKEGMYKCIIWRYKDTYEYEGKQHEERRVGAIGIYLNGVIPPQQLMKEIATIGVDAGLAGFFMNKPDYTDTEWEEFCNSIRKGDAWIKEEGFFSQSGYGDGGYPVYEARDKNNEIYALEIRFI